MRRASIQFRRVLFGVSCTIVFGFGATEAFANRTDQTEGGSCQFGTGWGEEACRVDCLILGYDQSSCSASNLCVCSGGASEEIDNP